MNISNFFTLNKGQWVVQRTLYNIKDENIYNHQYEITINYPTNSHIPKLELFVNRSIKKDISILAMKKRQEQFNKGSMKKFFNEKTIGYNFILYSNSVNYISLVNKIGILTIFERIWFVNPNLRLSISLIKKKNKYLLTSFTSEIKINS
uniref:Chromophore lyase CpcS/CpeS homolog n=1 Tax=Batrachospermum sp. TaxID=31373 RepID=A0A8K1YUS3_9FLOR|nr:phycobiliprotein lyase [Batrachospermum sp.]